MLDHGLDRPRAVTSGTAFQAPLERALRHALAYLDQLDRSPVAATGALKPSAPDWRSRSTAKASAPSA
jgi:hypothetical protein